MMVLIIYILAYDYSIASTGSAFRDIIIKLVPEFCTSRRVSYARRRTLMFEIRRVIRRNGTLRGEAILAFHNVGAVSTAQGAWKPPARPSGEN